LFIESPTTKETEMATVKIKFDTDNAAFEDSYATECQYVFVQAVHALLKRRDARLFDSNGNSIGTIVIEEEDDDES